MALQPSVKHTATVLLEHVSHRPASILYRHGYLAHVAIAAALATHKQTRLSVQSHTPFPRYSFPHRATPTPTCVIHLKQAGLTASRQQMLLSRPPASDRPCLPLGVGKITLERCPNPCISLELLIAYPCYCHRCSCCCCSCAFVQAIAAIITTVQYVPLPVGSLYSTTFAL